MQDGITQPSHGFHASKSDADRKGHVFGALEAQKSLRERVFASYSSARAKDKVPSATLGEHPRL